VGPLALVVAALIVVPTRIVSLMSIVAVPVVAGLLVVLAATGNAEPSTAVFAVIATVLIEFLHIPNMRRLLAGEEPRMGRGGERPATG
jgi:glycerol-3-phosphate acyltransferase PlsY